MDRRDFLKFTGAGALTSLSFSPSNLYAALAYYEDQPINAGWLNDQRVARYFIENNTSPYLSQIDKEIRGTGEGKVALLWQLLEELTGQALAPHEQEIGDCVSHAFGLGVDLLGAVQILKRNSPQRWVAKTATEIIYAGGRIDIAQNEYGFRWREGMTGTVAAEFIKRYGTLLRSMYLNKWDFTSYSGSVAKRLGSEGVPQELLPICRLHPVGCVTLVRSYEEARDCIYNGYPVALSSSQGFHTRSGRDRDGFLPPSRRPWFHSMLLIGMDDAHHRPGGLIMNSWGHSWVTGPKRHMQPDGSFWADASVIDRMCKQGDSIALSCFAGYPRQSYILW